MGRIAHMCAPHQGNTLKQLGGLGTPQLEARCAPHQGNTLKQLGGLGTPQLEQGNFSETVKINQQANTLKHLILLSSSWVPPRVLNLRIKRCAIVGRTCERYCPKRHHSQKVYKASPFSSSSGCGMYAIETDSPEILTSKQDHSRGSKGEAMFRDLLNPQSLHQSKTRRRSEIQHFNVKKVENEETKSQ